MTNLFLTVLEISASVSLIIIFLFLVSPLLNRRYASKWKYLIWIFLAVRLLVPLSGADGRSVLDMMLQRRDFAASDEEQSETNIIPAETVPRRVVVEIPARMTTPLEVQSEKNITLLDVAALIWASGGLLFVVVHLVSYMHYKRRVFKNGTVVKDVFILQEFLRLKRELGIRRAIPVIAFSEAASPMMMGFLKPVLILPEVDYSREELYFILKHELVHIKRGDVYWKFLFMTANGVHWFNPLVWLMQKEAVVDMELSCDEKVTQGADFAMKKAYTETLLATLHKGCREKTILSTGFYGGKRIMKIRFQNILRKTGKKNGFSVLVFAVALTICMGTLIGCSVAKENAEESSDEEGFSQMAGVQSEEEILSENLSAQKGSVEDMITLTIMKEGMAEEKQAELVVESRYILYLPVGEWQKYEADAWQAVANEDVKIGVAGFESGYPIERILLDDGYVPDEDGISKQEDGISYHTRFYETPDEIWLVQYSYPVEAEEGFGRELPVIADTFAVLLPGETITETNAISTQILGFISRFGGDTVTIDIQDWVVPESDDWKPEYDIDAGFEIVDLEGEDVTYPVRDDCTYYILENHQGESIEIDEEAFLEYLRETEFPIFWGMELEDGEVVSFVEWYRP